MGILTGTTSCTHDFLGMGLDTLYHGRRSSGKLAPWIELATI